MEWLLWLGLAYVIYRVSRFLWETHTHPANVLGRQAAHMNWVAMRTVKDKMGKRNMLYRRGELEAEVSYLLGVVMLVTPEVDKNFSDFIELERWLKDNGL